MRLIAGTERNSGGFWVGVLFVFLILLPWRLEATDVGGKPPEVSIPDVTGSLDIGRVEAKIAELEAINDLDPTTKTELESYQAALTQINEAKREKADFLRLKQSIDGAASSKEEIEASLEVVRGAMVNPSALSSDWTLEEIQQKLDRALADRQVVGNRLAELEARLTNERLRPAQAGEEITAVKARLSEIENELRTSEAGKDGGRQGSARWTVLYASQQAAKSRLSRLEMERLSQGPRTELLNLQIDLQRERLKQADQLVQRHQDLLTRKRATVAARTLVETAEVKRQVLGKHPVLLQLADENQSLSGDLGILTAQLRTAIAQKERLVGREALIKKNLERARQQLDIAGYAEAVGELLRAQRRELPDTKQLERQATAGHQEMARVRLEQFRVEDKREQVREIGIPSGDAVRKRPEGVSDEEWASLSEQIRSLEDDQLELLDKLQAAYGRYEKVLTDTNHVRFQLVDRIHEYATLLDRHLVWMPSTHPLTLQEILTIGRSLSFHAKGENLSAVTDRLIDRVSAYPVRSIGLLGFVLFLFLSRKRMRRELSDAVRNLGNVTYDSFSATLKVTLNTVLLAIPWGVVMGGAAWYLKSSSDPFVSAVSAGLYRAAVYLLLIQILRYIFMPTGLAEAHFKWSKDVIRLFRANLSWYLVVTVPVAFAVGFSEARPIDLHPEAVSRASAILGVLAAGLFAHRTLNPWTGVTRTVDARGERVWSWYVLWYFAAMGAVMLLLVQEYLGYYYSAQRLFYLIVMSLYAGIAVLVVYNLAERWLLVAERRLALRRARTRRQAVQEARAVKEAAEAAGESVQEPLDLDAFDLDEINEQSRRLLRFTGVTIVVMLLVMIWSELMPALGVLDEYVLWQYASEVSGKIDLIPVSIYDVGVALIVFILTIIAGSNLPGLLEIAILQPLSLEPGVRYAVSRVTSYVIYTGGTLFVVGILGMRWGDVQWLVAAMGVGLGFGLQEIFANFISGLLILFERPVRIGDTVTVGDVSGTVARVRTRATTITDWDNKELVVPNKAFITDRLINWTLSDPITRLVIPVGIAYGSDTDEAYRIMMDVISEHPDVLEEPNPTVFFVGFGESSLDFEIRVFVSERLKRMPLTHDLHMALNRSLQEADIEIPFPQRDLHIRSVDPSALRQYQEFGGEPSTGR